MISRYISKTTLLHFIGIFETAFFSLSSIFFSCLSLSIDSPCPAARMSFRCRLFVIAATNGPNRSRRIASRYPCLLSFVTRVSRLRPPPPPLDIPRTSLYPRTDNGGSASWSGSLTETIPRIPRRTCPLRKNVRPAFTSRLSHISARTTGTRRLNARSRNCPRRALVITVIASQPASQPHGCRRSMKKKMLPWHRHAPPPLRSFLRVATKESRTYLKRAKNARLTFLATSRVRFVYRSFAIDFVASHVDAKENVTLRNIYIYHNGNNVLTCIYIIAIDAFCFIIMSLSSRNKSSLSL